MLGVVCFIQTNSKIFPRSIKIFVLPEGECTPLDYLDVTTAVKYSLID